jgi:hypothetical protein
MNKKYVHSFDKLKSMNDETIYQLYHKVEWLIGDGESIKYIQNIIKQFKQ